MTFETVARYQKWSVAPSRTLHFAPCAVMSARGVEFCKLAESGHRTLLLSGAPYEFADAHDQAVDALAEFRSGVCGPHFRAGCRRFACQVRSLFRRHALHPYNAALAAAARA